MNCNCNCTQVLSVAAIILGLYILFSYFWNMTGETIKEKVSTFKGSSEFHMGCFLQARDLTHSQKLKQKLDYFYSNSVGNLGFQRLKPPSDVLTKKGIEVAKNFQTYIKQLTLLKSKSNNNNDLVQAIKEAKERFQICKSQVQPNQYFQSSCTSDWQKYSNCKNQLDRLKGELKTKLGLKQSILLQIKSLISQMRPSPPSDSKSPTNVDRQLIQRIKKLQDRIKAIELQIKILRQSVETGKFSLQQIKIKTIQYQGFYRQCQQRRYQYRLCEQINKEIRELGHNSLQKLQVKMRNKAEAVYKLQKILNQTYQDQSIFYDLKRAYQNNQMQYKKLHQLYIQTKTKMQKHCGCTQQDQAKFQREWIQSRQLQASKQKQINDILSKIAARQAQKKRLQEQLSQLLLAYRSKQKVPRPQDDRDRRLAELRLKLKLVHQEIDDINRRIAQLQEKCQAARRRLYGYLSVISDAKDCLVQYQYYEDLKRKNKNQKGDVVVYNPVSKVKLSQSLNVFTV